VDITVSVFCGVLFIFLSIFAYEILAFIRQLHLTMTNNRGSYIFCFIRSEWTWSCDRNIL